MKIRMTSCALALALLGAFLMLPGSTVAQTINNPLPVTGTCAGGGAFTGILDITSFAVQNGQLVALGNITGTCPSGTATNAPVAIPIDLSQATSSCSILDLVLGPIHLDLLGLVVDLNQVHLTITAEPGPGNLLGNLLCTIANLLNNNNVPLRGIAALLNAILGILG